MFYIFSYLLYLSFFFGGGGGEGSLEKRATVSYVQGAAEIFIGFHGLFMKFGETCQGFWR